MKRFILFLAILSICGSAYSQKITKNEKDAFTGSHVIETSYVTLSDGLPCSIRSVNGIHILLVSFNGGDEIYTMEKNAQFMFLLQNDSIVTLANLEDAVGEYRSLNVGSTYISHFLLKTKYDLSEEQIHELQTHKISNVRFYTTDGYIERKVSEKNAKKLLKLFNLINVSSVES